MIMLSSRQNTIRDGGRRAAPARPPRWLATLFAAGLLLTWAGCGSSTTQAAQVTGPESAAFDGDAQAGLNALDADQFPIAEKHFRAALARAQAWPESDPRIAMTLLNLGTTLTFETRFAEADADLARALQLAAAHQPENLDLRGQIEFRRGDLFRQKGDPDNALTWYSHADATFALCADHPCLWQSHVCQGLAMVNLSQLNKPDAAQPQFKRALDFLDQARQSDTIDYCELLNNYADCHVHRNDLSAAQALLDHAWQVEQKKYPDELVTAETAMTLGFLAYRDQKYADAETLLERAYAVFQKRLGAEARYTSQALVLLAEAHLANNHRDAGIAAYETWVSAMLARATEGTPDDREATAKVLAKLDLLYKADKKWDLALGAIDRLLAFYKKYGAADDPLELKTEAEAQNERSHLLHQLGRESEAQEAASLAQAMRAKAAAAPTPAPSAPATPSAPAGGTP